MSSTFSNVHSQTGLLANELTPGMLSRHIEAQLMPKDDARAARFAVIVVQLDRSDRSSALSGLERGRIALQQIRQRISSALRPNDRFCVSGIGELVAFLPGIDSQAVIGLAGTRLLTALEQPLQLGNKAALLRPAIGCAFFPDHGTEVEHLIGAADAACFRARTLPGRLEFVRDTTQNTEHNTLVDELRAALQANELEVWLQPQMSCHRRDIFAVEALIRWPRPAAKPPVHAGLIAQLAEDNGMMPAMTDFVINTALRHVRFLDTQDIHISVGVNLSASVLSDPDLPRRVGQALAIWNVPAQRLTLEVTESSLMEDFEGALAVMLDLKRLGSRMSIDDFGTGYSSLSYLRRMPLDELKIDQVFVRNLLDSASDLQIVQSVIDLAHHFKLEAVAEGVETKEIMDRLIGFGCDLIQGYLFSKPLRIDDFVRWWPTRLAPLALS
jgi:EAL domain-containing protein (putative c-di-GMP-specific phosphodiesterase class I)/GGDEF domain-containing protein